MLVVAKDKPQSAPRCTVPAVYPQRVLDALAREPAHEFLASCGARPGDAQLPEKFYDDVRHVERFVQVCAALACGDFLRTCEICEERENTAGMMIVVQPRSNRYDVPRLTPSFCLSSVQNLHSCVRVGVLSLPRPHACPDAFDPEAVVQEVDLGRLILSDRLPDTDRYLRATRAVAALLATAQPSVASLVLHVGALPVEELRTYVSQSDERATRMLASALRRNANIRRVVLNVLLSSPPHFMYAQTAPKYMDIILDACDHVTDLNVVLHVCHPYRGDVEWFEAENSKGVELAIKKLAAHVERRRSALSHLGVRIVCRAASRDSRRSRRSEGVDDEEARYDLYPLLRSLAASEACPRALTIEYHTRGFVCNRSRLRMCMSVRCAADAGKDASAVAGSKDCGAERSTDSEDSAPADGGTGAGSRHQAVLRALVERLQSLRLVNVAPDEVACFAALATRSNLRVLFHPAGDHTASSPVVRETLVSFGPTEYESVNFSVSELSFGTACDCATAGTLAGTGTGTSWIAEALGLGASLVGMSCTCDDMSPLLRGPMASTFRDVQHLTLSFPESMPHWYESESKVPDLPPRLRSLELVVPECQAEWPVATALQRATHLTSLKLLVKDALACGRVRTGRAERSLCRLADAVAAHGSITSLTVRGYECSGLSFRRMADAVRRSATLRELEITSAFVEIKQEDAAYLGSALARNASTQLRSIALGSIGSPCKPQSFPQARVVEELARCFASSHVLWCIRLAKYQKVGQAPPFVGWGCIADIRRTLLEIERERAALRRDACSWGAVRAQIEGEKERAASQGVLPRGLGAFRHVPTRARGVISSFVAPRWVAPTLVLYPIS